VEHLCAESPELFARNPISGLAQGCPCSFKKMGLTVFSASAVSQ
jgi:hypothetical protein